jgi:acyl-CoA thioester hydrolase
LSGAAMQELPVYGARIEPEWIDYNGHLRDAYYGLVLSYATDDMMEHVGLGADYRRHTRCTLFTLEVHINYLHEVKRHDDLSVRTSVLDHDAKRILAGCTFHCAGRAAPVATAEALLLHVLQGDKPAATPFPPEVAARLATLQLNAGARAAFAPASRKIELRRR